MDTPVVIVIVLFAGSAQGFLLSVALFSVRKGNRTALRMLATLLFLFSLLIFFHASGQLGDQRSAIHEDEWFGHAIFLLFGPLLFFYSKALTQRGFRLRKDIVLHVLPSLAVFVDAGVTASFGFSIFLSVLYGLMPWMMAAQMFAYLIAIRFLLQEHAKNIRDNFSSLEKVNLRWLQFIVYCQMVIWPVAFIAEIQKRGPQEMNIVWLLVSLFMYLLGYFGIRQPDIIAGQCKDVEFHRQDAKKKYERSTLSSEEAELILQRLQNLMQTAKPFLQNDLTLYMVSQQLSVSQHHLSQVINERLGKNYFEFINTFRIDEAKRLLKDPQHQHLTLAAIGFEAGFNSVSSFNSVFKKATSYTPSQFRSASV